MKLLLHSLRNSIERRLRLLRWRPAFKHAPPAFHAEQSPLAENKLLLPSHAEWVSRFDTPDEEALRYLAQTADHVPPVLVVVKFDNASIGFVAETRRCLHDMLGVRWSAIFSFHASCEQAEVDKVKEQLAGDAKIACAGEAGREDDVRFIVSVKGGALPRAHGIRLLLDALIEAPNAGLAYGDEDHVDHLGAPRNPWFKPAFSPLVAEAGILLGNLVALRTEGAAQTAALVRKLSSPETDCSDVVLGLALSIQKEEIVHVPNIVFHDRLPQTAAKEQKIPELPKKLPMVSVIIPNKDRWDLLQPCLNSLYKTEWPKDRFEIIVIDNGSSDPACLSGLEAEQKKGTIKVIRDDGEFNYARLNNLAVQQASGSVFVMLNNDTEMIEPGWLKMMASYALAPGIGAVGAKLLYPDGTVQHGGVILGIRGFGSHAHRHLGADDPGYRGLANLTHEVSAVTGACMAVSREAYDAVGGLNEKFRIAYNDVVFCLDLLRSGYTNIYIGKPLFVHLEAESRGYDDTQEKRAVAREEAMAAWTLHAPLMRADPYYSPNLSLEKTYVPAFAPRRRLSWLPANGRSLHVLMLSITYAAGHEAPVVIRQQAERLVALGHKVTLGGHVSNRDLEYPNCDRIEVIDPKDAAAWAAEHAVDVIVSHTYPFFSVARWTGAFPPVVAYDHGDPPAELFADKAVRELRLEEKQLSLLMCTSVYAISESVAAESRAPVDGVIPLGNGHLGQWNDRAIARRATLRSRRGWGDRYVVMNACRFHTAERVSKGIETYLATKRALDNIAPEIGKDTIFILCGAGSAKDVAALKHAGLDVYANVTDDELFDLYAVSDAYANFSKWEGYNLGIGQALAMGLPAVASNIPAHRAFGIPLVDTPAEAAKALVSFRNEARQRTARIWETGLSTFVEKIQSLGKAGR